MAKKTDVVIPGVDQLEATPEILRLLMSGLSEEQALWKPAPGRFSVAEVLEHLAHVEGHAYRAKIDRMLEEDNPEVAAYEMDKYVAQGIFSGADPEESFAHFEEQRETNLERLRELTADDLGRTARHSTAGTITLRDLLNEWAFHDLGHIRQIAELVRAARYYPEMGAYRDHYTVKP